MINYVSSGKAMTVSLIAELIKKRDNIKWTRVIIKKKIKIELDLPNYAAKSDVKKPQLLIHQNPLENVSLN